MSFQQEVQDEAVKMMSGYNITELLRMIKTASLVTGLESRLPGDLIDIAHAVVSGAASTRLNAAYGGSHGDGGAGRHVDDLKSFLQGVVVGLTGEVPESFPYAHTLKKIKQESDPEYQKYLELKAKFGDNK